MSKPTIVSSSSRCCNNFEIIGRIQLSLVVSFTRYFMYYDVASHSSFRASSSSSFSLGWHGAVPKFPVASNTSGHVMIGRNILREVRPGVARCQVTISTPLIETMALASRDPPLQVLIHVLRCNSINLACSG